MSLRFNLGCSFSLCSVRLLAEPLRDFYGCGSWLSDELHPTALPAQLRFAEGRIWPGMHFKPEDRARQPTLASGKPQAATGDEAGKAKRENIERGGAAYNGKEGKSTTERPPRCSGVQTGNGIAASEALPYGLPRRFNPCRRGRRTISLRSALPTSGKSHGSRYRPLCLRAGQTSAKCRIPDRTVP